MWSSLKNYTDAVLLVARVILGLTLLCLRAWPHLLRAFDVWIHHPARHHFWESVMSSLLSAGETLASILMILGLWMRPASLLWGLLVGVIAFGEARRSIHIAQPHIDLALLLLIFVFTGAGRYSMDKE